MYAQEHSHFNIMTIRFELVISDTKHSLFKVHTNYTQYLHLTPVLGQNSHVESYDNLTKQQFMCVCM